MTPYSATLTIPNPVALLFAVQAPDEAHRTWCPNCGFVLAEALGIGSLVRFLCRNCRWEGVIQRASSSLVTSAYTLRAGRRSTHIAQRLHTARNPSNPGNSGNPD